MKQASTMWPLWPGDEDWFRPLHPRGCVRVTRHEMEENDHRARSLWTRKPSLGPDPVTRGRPCRVSVWGNDDSGMERDDLTAEEADALIRDLPNPLTHAWLVAHGFRRA